MALQPIKNQPGQVSPISKSPPDNFTGLEGIQGDGVVLVGKGTRMVGEISDCTVVEIQGILEGTVTADAVIIREGGGFQGELQAGHAEVHGVVDGKVTVHGLLDVRSTGQVSGELAYEQFSVAIGANVVGNLATPATINGTGANPANSQSVDSNGMNGTTHQFSELASSSTMSNGSAASTGSASTNGSGGLGWTTE